MGIPKEILSDNGRQFISSYFKNKLKENNIKQRLTLPYNPRGNSITERVMSTIGNVMRQNSTKPPSIIIRKAMINLNDTYHSILGTKPRQIITNYDPLDPRKIKSDVKQHAITRSKSYYDAKRSISNNPNTNTTLKIGDTVYIKRPIQIKTDNPFDGPYKVKNIKGNAIQVTNDVKTSWQHIRNTKI